MNRITDSPRYTRLLFIALALVMFSTSIGVFINYAGSPTDENVFFTTPEGLYLTVTVPAKLVTSIGTRNFMGTEEKIAGDSLVVGDILVFADNLYTDESISIAEKDEFVDFLAEADSQTVIELNIFRSRLNRFLRYHLPAEDFDAAWVREISASVTVREVLPNGASDRAGLQVGDLIYSINGERFKDANSADRIMRFAQLDKTIAYDIVRDNQTQTLHLTLARVGLETVLLIILLCGLFFIGSGLFVGLKRPEYVGARLMAISFMLIGFYLTLFSPLRALPNQWTNLVNLLQVGALVFGVATWFHMHHYFPREFPALRNRRWIIMTVYILGLSAILFNAFGQGGFANLLFSITIIMFWVLPWFYRKLKPHDYVEMNSVIRWTSVTLLFVMIGLVTIPLLFGRPPDFVFRTIDGRYSIVLMALFPMAYLYTIGRYNLFNMDIRIRRNILYTLVYSLWGMTIAVAFLFCIFKLPTLELALPNIRFMGSYIEVVDEPMEIARKIVLEKGFVILAGILLLLLFWRILLGGQSLLNKKFYREKYDYKRAANEMAEVMSNQFGLEELAKGIVKNLVNQMQLKQAGVIFLESEKIRTCQTHYGINEDAWNTFCDTTADRIIQLVQQHKTDDRFSSDYLRTDLRTEFEGAGFRHIIAIRSKFVLVGILLLGEKRSEAAFHKDDLVFLSSVARQSSVAIENAFLYNELAERERLRHELEIARRIQIASLPQHTPEISGLDIAGISIPAQEVGGDYFDYLNGVREELTVIVGDVSGKGTSAALYMSKIQGIMRSLYDFGLSPRELLIRANQLLAEDLEKQSFITAVGASFNATQHELVMARAGHMPLYYYNAATNHVEEVSPKGIGLGLTKSATFATELEEISIPYRPGDVFLFITDGITEAQDEAGEEFGDETMISLLQDNHDASAKRIRDQLVTAVNNFAGSTNQHDDLTVVVVKAVEPALTAQSPA